MPATADKAEACGKKNHAECADEGQNPVTKGLDDFWLKWRPPAPGIRQAAPRIFWTLEACPTLAVRKKARDAAVFI